DSVELFQVSPEAIKAFPNVDFTGKTIIAFVPSDRDRFFRTYFAGIRLKTYFSEDDYKRPPAMLDITFGQIEAVTGGRLRGGVFRIEGFYPLPINFTSDKTGFLYLFGSANMKFSRTNIQDPLILAPAPSTTPFPASNVVFITVPQLNRDYYRI